MRTTESGLERPVCPTCGHENITGAEFCAQCGQSLNGDPPAHDPPGVPDDDVQVTSTYAPIGATRVDVPRSHWAPPIDHDAHDPGQTSALPVASRYSSTDPDPAPMDIAQPAYRESKRGFVLGVLATLLIAMVLALYLYSAWLGDGARDTIDGWLPWLS